jgi:hypothetical protein
MLIVRSSRSAATWELIAVTFCLVQPGETGRLAGGRSGSKERTRERGAV